MEASQSQQELDHQQQLSPTGVFESETNRGFASPDFENMKRISMITFTGRGNERGVTVAGLGVSTVSNDDVHSGGGRAEASEQTHSRFYHVSKHVQSLPFGDNGSELVEQDEEYEYEEITVNSECAEDDQVGIRKALSAAATTTNAASPKSTGEYTFETVTTDDNNKADDNDCNDDDDYDGCSFTCYEENIGSDDDNRATTSKSGDTSIPGFTLIIHHNHHHQSQLPSLGKRNTNSRSEKFDKHDEEDILNSSHLSSSGMYDWEYLMESPSKWTETIDEAPFKLPTNIDRKRKLDVDSQSVLEELVDCPSSKLKKKQESPQRHHRAHST